MAATSIAPESKPAGAPGAGAALSPIVLDLKQVDDLFVAPACNPFSAYEVEVLGQSGTEWLQKHYRRRWPRHHDVHDLVIRLPLDAQPETPEAQAVLEQQVQAGLARTCAEQVRQRQMEMRLAFVNARRELLIAAAVTVLAVLLLFLAVRGIVIPWLNLQYFVTLLAVFAASLAIWDALESLFFDWVPYMVENGADRWIASLDIRVVYGAAITTDGA